MTRVHAFTDDALGDHDAVTLAELVRTGAVSREELAAAAAARSRAVEDVLAAVAFDARDDPRWPDSRDGALDGVPTFVKDNTDVRGMPTNHGSEAYRARPAKRDGAYAAQLRSTGLSVLGKSRMPEFGFNATSEFMTGPPVRNPWHPDHSVGASSGGAAAMVAAGVVPLAHANDGGGSIRIPAACAGLVGLKPSRGRHLDGEQARHVPINMVSEGVLTRAVRDTAAYLAAAERHWRNPALPPIGNVLGPAPRRLRVGLVLDSVVDAPLDPDVRRAVERTAALLEGAGHVVEPVELPITAQFATDFVQYWALLAELAVDTATVVLSRTFDRARIDGLTRGLRAHHRRHLHRTPGALLRLRQVPRRSRELTRHCDVVLSPVLAHPAPPLGLLSPTVAFDELIERLTRWVSYTPLHNIAGLPAISVPAGLSSAGLPVGVMLSSAHGDERTLLELAFLLEAAEPFPRIQD